MGCNVELPKCSKCRTPLAATAIVPGEFVRCPACEAELRVEFFPALVRPINRSSIGEAAMNSGEATCYYHDAKKAVALCDGCGRFLCGLCDCQIASKHFCPACLEPGRQKELETSRPLHAQQALLLAFLPFLFTGLAALYFVIRYWKSPGSLVARQRWIMPVALALALIQVLGYTALIIFAIVG
jgi:hypothetical protein